MLKFFDFMTIYITVYYHIICEYLLSKVSVGYTGILKPTETQFDTNI